MHRNPAAAVGAAFSRGANTSPISMRKKDAGSWTPAQAELSLRDALRDMLWADVPRRLLPVPLQVPLLTLRSLLRLLPRPSR